MSKKKPRGNRAITLRDNKIRTLQGDLEQECLTNQNLIEQLKVSQDEANSLQMIIDTLARALFIRCKEHKDPLTNGSRCIELAGGLSKTTVQAMNSFVYAARLG